MGRLSKWTFFWKKKHRWLTCACKDAPHNYQGNANPNHSEISITSHLSESLLSKRSNKCGQRCRRKWILMQLLLEIKIGAALYEKFYGDFSKYKQNYHMTQQFHFWLCIWRKWKHLLKKIYAPSCSLENYLS